MSHTKEIDLDIQFEMEKIRKILTRNHGSLTVEAVYYGLMAMKETPSLSPSVALEVGDREFNK